MRSSRVPPASEPQRLEGACLFAARYELVEHAQDRLSGDVVPPPLLSMRVVQGFGVREPHNRVATAAYGDSGIRVHDLAAIEEQRDSAPRWNDDGAGGADALCAYEAAGVLRAQLERGQRAWNEEPAFRRAHPARPDADRCRMPAADRNGWMPTISSGCRGVPCPVVHPAVSTLPWSGGVVEMPGAKAVERRWVHAMAGFHLGEPFRSGVEPRPDRVVRLQEEPCPAADLRHGRIHAEVPDRGCDDVRAAREVRREVVGFKRPVQHVAAGGSPADDTAIDVEHVPVVRAHVDHETLRGRRKIHGASEVLHRRVASRGPRRRDPRRGPLSLEQDGRDWKRSLFVRREAGGDEQGGAQEDVRPAHRAQERGRLAGPGRNLARARFDAAEPARV